MATAAPSLDQVAAMLLRNLRQRLSFTTLPGMPEPPMVCKLLVGTLLVVAITTGVNAYLFLDVETLTRVEANLSHALSNIFSSVVSYWRSQSYPAWRPGGAGVARAALVAGRAARPRTQEGQPE